MKSVTFILAILIEAGFNSSWAQNIWTKKADFGGGMRWGATSFSINTKGYIGTGYDGQVYKKDFWEYDPNTDSWSQKANFGGHARYHATGFSIGSKGYIGTGHYSGNFYNDFWEYDPITNTWSQKANFGGSARWAAIGFSIGNKGYLGTGRDGPGENNRNDFWEYDPDTDKWTQRANYGGGNRYLVIAFNISNKGYIGTGWDGSSYKKDFWEYDPVANTWTKKADFGGAPREGATSFSIGSKGYIGMGHAGGLVTKNDFWEYDPGTNTWIQRANCGSNGCSFAIGFNISNKGYIGTGYDYSDPFNDFWEYTPDGVLPCTIPTSLSTPNITPTMANLKWDAANGVIGYKVRYKIAGDPLWTNLQSIDNDKTLHGLATSTKYVWQVKSICDVLPIISSGWSEKQFFTSDGLRLEDVNKVTYEVYPNPVSQSATISFYLSEESPVVIEIVDVNGRALKMITDDIFSSGNHEVELSCESLNAGIYFFQMKTNEGVMIKKVILLH